MIGFKTGIYIWKLTSRKASEGPMTDSGVIVNSFAITLGILAQQIFSYNYESRI